MTQRIRVLCVDDHRLVRDGIGLIISSEADLEVAGFAATSDEAVAQFARLAPDITLMDLRLGSGSGLSAIHAIRRTAPAARIIVLTMYGGDEHIHQALAAGASTYLLKDSLADELIGTIRAVHAGARPLSNEVRARLEARASRPTLTSREVQVLELVARGHRNKEVGAILGISEDTVPVHLKSIFVKLNVNDRMAAVNVAVRRGIVQLE